MHSNDVLNYTKNDSLKTEMFAVLILITNNVMTGLTSFLTGLVIEFASSLGLVD